MKDRENMKNRENMRTEEHLKTFRAKWITTHDFLELEPIDLFHKELAEFSVKPSALGNYHVHFRKVFAIPKAQKITVNISADDYYKLYVNGRFVCQGPAAAYPEYYNYNQVDISEYVQEGENVIAVHVYYQGLINRVWYSGDNRMGLIADIYADGAYVCGTDDTWLYERAMEYGARECADRDCADVECVGQECADRAEAEKIGYDTQFLEHIDFRKKKAGWKNQDFAAESQTSAAGGQTRAAEGRASAAEGWTRAVVKESDDHIFMKEPAVCLEVYRMEPKEVVKLGAGSWFLDFGTELVGQFAMKMKGVSGQKVRILCGEETVDDEPYQARSRMRCNCNYDETCILSGQEDELEFFDYKAFRYVNIISEYDNLEPESFCAIVRHHPFEEKCRLESDLPWAEDIWKLCVNSLKWGTQEGYLDCPSREKGQYLGDFSVTGLAHMYVTGDSKMYRKTLYDFAQTTKVCKGIMAVSSGALMQEIADFSLQYPMQVLHYYQYTGDLDTLKELYPVVEGILTYFEAYEREDGLLEHADEKWNLIDWPQNLRDDYELSGAEHGEPRPCHNVLNAHYIGGLIYLQKIQSLLGITPDEEKLRKRKEAFLKAFYCPETGLFTDLPGGKHAALHSNVLPVFYGIAPKESWNSIRKLIMDKGLVCGTMFSYFVLKALGRMGAYEEELALILNESEHSWVNMLREGATTVFEAWGKEQKWNTSLCHPWSSAPIIALIEDILQVDPREFGRDGVVTVLELQKP